MKPRDSEVRRIFEQILDQHPRVLVVCDTSHEELGVPDFYKKRNPLPLMITTRAAHQPTWDDNGVKQRLAFQGVWSVCFIPWSCVVTLSDGESGIMLSPEDQTDQEEPQPAQRPKLTLIKGGKPS